MSSSNSTSGGSGDDSRGPLLLATEYGAASLYVLLLAAMLFALFGRYHSRVLWVRRYFIIVAIMATLRATKLLVPALAYYRPLSGQLSPPIGSADWWTMMAEWLMYISGNAAE